MEYILSMTFNTKSSKTTSLVSMVLKVPLQKHKCYHL